MGIGTSIFLIALGAILKYAVNAEVSGLEISTIGVILMIVGALGLIISLLYATMWRRDRDVAAAPADRPVVRERDVY
jgi:beta-lactamase regulating signal transducer with metallopeptidase domain